MPDKGFETKNGKEVSCETMVPSFPVFWNEMIYAMFFIFLLKNFANIYKICRNFLQLKV